MKYLITYLFPILLLLSLELQGSEAPSALDSAEIQALGLSNNELVEMAISGAISWHALDIRGRPVFLLALIHGSIDDLRFYLESSVGDPNAQHLGIPLAGYAISDSCHPKKLETLLEAGADPNASMYKAGDFFLAGC